MHYSSTYCWRFKTFFIGHKISCGKLSRYRGGYKKICCTWPLKCQRPKVGHRVLQTLAIALPLCHTYCEYKKQIVFWIHLNIFHSISQIAFSSALKSFNFENPHNLIYIQHDNFQHNQESFSIHNMFEKNNFMFRGLLTVTWKNTVCQKRQYSSWI